MNLTAAPERPRETAPPDSYRHHLDVAFRPILVALLGILLPLAALLVELATHTWAGVLMDPIPTWWHVAAILTVPVSCIWAWWSLNRPAPIHQALFHMNACALGVSIAYTVGFLPTMPLALIGCIVMGLGFLPLSPLLAIIPLVSVRAALVRRLESEGVRRTPTAVWPAATLAFALLAAGVFQHLITRSLVQQATSENGSESMRAISLLRWIGNEKTMVEACYGAGGGTGMWSRSPIDPEKARSAFFRVTGRSFSSSPIPASASNRMLGDRRWNFDPSLGQDRVANHVPDLFITDSRMDVQINTTAATSYSEWTLVFRNDALNASEARALVDLPPGGVVSRLTLWINGEPREAAFGGRGQVRAAYQEVAVAQRRDPVLVTTAGGDRILMQCFPVPPGGGEMKVRIGITAPLRLASAETGSLDLPRFVEVNFESGRDLKHHISAEGDAPLVLGSASGKKLLVAVDDAVFQNGRSISVARNAVPGTVFADHISDASLAIRQTLAQVKAERPSRVVFVIDGSKPARAAREQLVKSVADIPDGMPFGAVFAGDTVEALEIASANPQSRTAAARWMNDRGFAGGQDNIPALVLAWDIAAAEPGTAIVWLHASQPETLSSLSPLEQRMERAARNAPRIYLAPLAAGPNRIAEKLDSFRAFRNVRELTLDGMIRSWAGTGTVLTLQRDVVPASEVPADAVRADRHLARLWALAEVGRLAGNSDAANAQKLAVDAQLVTPVSGAVVLETQAQYDRHGLTPVDPATVPIVPEPGSAALLLGGALCMALRRFRRHAANAGNGARSDG